MVKNISTPCKLKELEFSWYNTKVKITLSSLSKSARRYEANRNLVLHYNDRKGKKRCYLQKYKTTFTFLSWGKNVD